MTADQVTAFTSNSGFAPQDLARLLIAAALVTLLVWGVWALRTAYVGWAENSLSGRQCFAVLVRVAALYLVLTYFLLS